MNAYNLYTTSLPRYFHCTTRRHDEVPSTLHQPGREEGLQSKLRLLPKLHEPFLTTADGSKEV